MDITSCLGDLCESMFSTVSAIKSNINKKRSRGLERIENDLEEQKEDLPLRQQSDKQGMS